MQLRSHNATRKLVGQTNLKDASSSKAHAGNHKEEEVEPALALYLITVPFAKLGARACLTFIPSFVEGLIYNMATSFG